MTKTEAELAALRAAIKQEPPLPWGRETPPQLLSELYAAWRDAGGIYEATNNGPITLDIEFRQRVWWAVLRVVEQHRPMLPEAYVRIETAERERDSAFAEMKAARDDLEVAMVELESLRESIKLAAQHLNNAGRTAESAYQAAKRERRGPQPSLAEMPHPEGLHTGPCRCTDGCGACDGCGRWLGDGIPNGPSPAEPPAVPSQTVMIGSDGRCGCDGAARCPLGRAGSALRCTAAELRNAGVSIMPRPPQAVLAPLTVGDRVRIHYNTEHNRQYVQSAWLARHALDGRIGEIIERGDGHGVTFRVRVSVGLEAWYEPDELSPEAP